MIPIVIICFNNHKYVENMVRQIVKKNPSYQANIIIMDNASTDPNTHAYLNTTTCRVIRNSVNQGPWVNHYYNTNVFKEVGPLHILTDADLELNENMPSNFIEHMLDIMNYTNSWIVGFALKRDDCDLEYGGKPVFEYEAPFWEKPVSHPLYELYHAGIDTTFALRDHRGNRQNFPIRIAGNFTMRHLPWYKEDGVLTIADKHNLYTTSSKVISGAATSIMKYIENDFSVIQKRDKQIFLKKNEGKNYNYWFTYYPNWENDLFVIFDRLLSKDKVFIDIGAWIGLTGIYASRNSKHVYAIEADAESVKELRQNCQYNCDNVTIVDKAIAHTSDKTVFLGKNAYLPNDSLNDSTSQVFETQKDGRFEVTTISISDLISRYSISNISLIKVDIEGGEEDILEDLYQVHSTLNVPINVSFHIDWWKDRNIDRFSFLTNDQKSYLRMRPFGDILFESTK